ncbi:MAG: nuclear transport factor 2 family protein [Ferruginibacter sp.]
MKKIIPLLVIICCFEKGFSQTTRIVSIHFRLDLSGEIKNVQSPSSIGIRGNVAPLSWDKTYLLKDDNKDGIYEATINFETVGPQLRIKYKYFYDTASWEKSEDRVIATKENKLNPPVDKWNVLAREHTAAYMDSVETAELYNTVIKLDSLLFDAYNNCKIDQYASLISENLEFYHDKGGLSTSKKDNVEAIRKNICNKVRRELQTGSIEVSPIPGYGAVEIGSHRFHNLIENSTSGYAKFIIVWQNKNGVWQATRVISLHK